MLKIIILLLSLLGMTLALLVDGFEFQFFCVLLSITVFFIVLSTMVKNTIAQYASILIFALGISFACLELYYGFRTVDPSKYWTVESGSFPKLMIQGDENLSFTVAPNSLAIVKKDAYNIFNDDATNVYDVVYTSNEYGHRTVPVNPEATIAVVFVGCSFTFGMGLNDEDTFAFKVGERLGKNYQVFNLGVGGYGTHQVLAILQGDMSYLNKYDQVYIFHTTIFDHLQRFSGFVPWSNTAPRYMLEGGKLVRKGHLGEYFPYDLYPNFITKVVKSSFTLRANLYNLKMMILPYTTTEERWPLYTALIAESENVMKKKFPDSITTVIVWELFNNKEMIQHLPEDILYVDVHDWFPDFKENRRKYGLVADDHPNPYATNIAADKIVEIINKYESAR